jgi:hypothetical protein
MAVTFDKKRRNTVIICEGLKDDSPDLYKRIVQDIVKNGWRHGTKDNFIKGEINIDSVRYGFFRANVRCGVVFKKLLERNVPVIIAGSYTDEELNDLILLIDDALPDVDKDGLKKLIFKVKDEEKIEGAIHWAEEFYPYLYDNIVKETMAMETKKERLLGNVASRTYMDAKEGGI